MITINLSDKDAEVLKCGCNYLRSLKAFNDNEVNKNVIQQINNQQFDVSDFESSRQYESLSINAVYIDKKVWDKARVKK